MSDQHPSYEPIHIVYRVRQSGSTGLWHPERSINSGPWRRVVLAHRRHQRGYESRAGAVAYVREFCMFQERATWADGEPEATKAAHERITREAQS